MADRQLRVLMIEDSEEDALLLLRELRRGGYEPEFERVETAETMRPALLEKQWDILISDYMLPNFNGLAALDLFRESGLDLPFIIVSGNIGEDIAVGAMKAGAHDYILKDNLARLVPAVEREIREAAVRRERRLAEGRLRESEERYKSLFDHSIDGILLASPDGSVLAANPGACRILGRTEGELLKVRRETLVDIADPRTRAYYEERDRTGRAHGEITCIRKDGSKFPCELSSALFMDKDGNTRISIIMRDITDRKETEKKIFRLNRLYSVLSKVNEAIVRLGEPERLFEQVCRIAVEDGRFKMAWIGLVDNEKHTVTPVVSYGDDRGYLHNIKIYAADVPEGLGPTGRAAFEGVSSICSDIGSDPRMLPWRDKALEHGFQSSAAFPLYAGPAVIGTFTIYSGDPQFFTEEETGLLSSLANDISFAIDSINNRRRRLEAEAESMHSSRLATIGELAAGVAHEINNPVNGIINYAQLLADKLDGKSREHDIAERIMKEGDRISYIVTSLLSFSRQRKEGKKAVRLEEIISESMALTGAHTRKDGIVLEVDIPQDLPRIFANPQQLQQVMLNLISNARYALNQKYPSSNEDKKFEIRANQTAINDMPYVRIEFTDHGTGMPAAIVDKVLNPFFSTKPEGQGTGLGLSISHGIISDHGGRLSIESVEGEFTKVIVDLPVYRSKEY